MEVWTARHLWRTLDRGKREEIALSLWEDERLSRAERAAALAPWLTARGMREAFLNKLPRTRRAGLLAEGGVPEETASQLLTSYHLTRKRPLLARFLDLLEIKHEEGIIAEEEELQPPEKEKVSQAASRLEEEFPGDDVALYLRTLVVADPVTWEAVGEVVGAPKSD